MANKRSWTGGGGVAPEAAEGRSADYAAGRRPPKANDLYDGLEDPLAGLLAPTGVDEFFGEVWQREPRVFRSPEHASSSSTAGCPPRPLSGTTWADCCDMLGAAWGCAPVPPPDGCDLLMFKGRMPVRDYDESGPWAALLDGASCVVNHAEYVWEPFTRLCLALRRRLLHVYCNSYTTPPDSQAVPMHADDRDVLVVQLCGSKHWRVWGAPPVMLPYPHEQVGKNGLDVPAELSSRPPLIETVLQPGDVLYMPRGFVHEAECTSESSWHATLAIATHDWSWTRVFTSALERVMDTEPSSRWRLAVPLGLGFEGGREAEVKLEKELEDLMQVVREVASEHVLRNRMTAKIATHNDAQEKAAADFRAAFSDWAAHTGDNSAGGCSAVSGCDLWRSRLAGSDTRVRCATKEEKAQHAEAKSAAAARWGATRRVGKGRGKGKSGKGGSSGFMVREEVANAVILILAEMDKQQSAGMAVSAFRDAVPEASDKALLDDLAQICLARVCIRNGAFRLATEPPLPAAEEEADDEVKKDTSGLLATGTIGEGL